MIFPITAMDRNKISDDDYRKLYAAVQQSVSTVLITDAEGFIEFVNPRFTRLTGYSLDEVIGKRPSIIQSGKTPPEVYQEMWTTIKAGNEWRGELLNKRKDGTYYWGSLTVSPIRDSEERITHFLGIEEDITVRKRMELQLQNTLDDLMSANKRLKELDALKNEFLGMVAHDLRSPLAKLDLSSALLLDEDLSEKDKRMMLEILNRSVGGMLQLVNDLLDVTKIESGTIVLRPRSVNLKEYIEEVYQANFIHGTAKNIMLVADLDEHLPEEITFDPERMMQVFNNLLSNAFKFSPRGTTVCLRVTPEGQAIRVSVIDQGPGIKEKEIQRLFQPFQRLSAQPTGGESSTGLGLLICRKIVEMHRGVIGVETSLCQGSIFYFTLPKE